MVRTQLTLKWHFDTIFKFISDKLFQVSMKDENDETQEGARHCRKPLGRRHVGSKISTIIITYLHFVTFTHSNILLGISWKSILESVNVIEM